MPTSDCEWQDESKTTYECFLKACAYVDLVTFYLSPVQLFGLRTKAFDFSPQQSASNHKQHLQQQQRETKRRRRLQHRCKTNAICCKIRTKLPHSLYYISRFASIELKRKGKGVSAWPHLGVKVAAQGGCVELGRRAADERNKVKKEKEKKCKNCWRRSQQQQEEDISGVKSR